MLIKPGMLFSFCMYLGHFQVRSVTESMDSSCHGKYRFSFSSGGLNWYVRRPCLTWGVQCALSHVSKANAVSRYHCDGHFAEEETSPHSHFFRQSQDEGSFCFKVCHFNPSLGFSCEGETPVPILGFLCGSPTSPGAVSHCRLRCDPLDSAKGTKALSNLTQPFSPLTPARGIIYSRHSVSLRIWASLSGVCVAQYFPHRVPSSSYAIIVESDV